MCSVHSDCVVLILNIINTGRKNILIVAHFTVHIVFLNMLSLSNIFRPLFNHIPGPMLEVIRCFITGPYSLNTMEVFFKLLVIYVLLLLLSLNKQYQHVCCKKMSYCLLFERMCSGSKIVKFQPCCHFSKYWTKVKH